ncbi:alanine racemase [Hyphomicrobium sp.]|uniref:alanine racemase n=1 Tax=Hyphomicrobium sp. TaxID=82 RepID=UPI002D76E70F|nr:alanine racemase [Hyphomicrobium sp.]HET6388322.1 alanine racemase [Hyphomicrobium sp.]
MNVVPRKNDLRLPQPPRTGSAAEQFRNPNLKLIIDLGLIRRNVEHIAESCGVPLLPVVKADAYGLGIEAVAETIADLAEAFCVFQAREAIAADLTARTGKRALVLGPPEFSEAEDYIAHRLTPTVCNPSQARELRKARPALCVDTGMQRFACPPEDCREALIAGDCREAFTHATELAHAEKLYELTAHRDVKRHAAASSLLDHRQATLNAVRPGLAMYRNAVTISSPIVELHHSRGPAGYSGFTSARHGVILAGYAHGLRKGPCLIKGRKSKILEVGMQSAFVEAEPGDKVGDDVVLLGGSLETAEIAASWNCSPHEVLRSLTSAATRHYRYS